MAENKTTGKSGESDNHASIDPVMVTGERKVQKHAASPQTVTVVFRANRKFDLHVGRNIVVFLGREAKEIPRDWLEHPDFKQVRRYFVVKGV